MPLEGYEFRNLGYRALQGIPAGKGGTAPWGDIADRLLDEASEIVDELIPDEEPPPDDSTSWEDDSTSWEDEEPPPPPPPPPADTVSSMTASIIGVAIIGAIGWVLLS